MKNRKKMNSLKKKYKQNVKKPQKSILGILQLLSMNKRHTPLAEWGRTYVDFDAASSILDIGFGGGENLKVASKLAPKAKLFGIDYSVASVQIATKKNRKLVNNGRLTLTEGSVEQMPYENDSFDLVTAYETIYFWNIEKGFKEVYRVLKEDGTFAIINEAKSEVGMEEHIEAIGFRVYTEEEIRETLTRIGFREITAHSHENGNWLTVTAKK